MSGWFHVTIHKESKSDVKTLSRGDFGFGTTFAHHPSMWSRVKPHTLSLTLVDHYPEGVAFLILNYADDYTTRCETCQDLAFIPDPESRSCDDCQCAYHPTCQASTISPIMRNKCQDCQSQYVPCAFCGDELCLVRVHETFQCLYCKKAFHLRCHALHAHEEFCASCHDCYLEQHQLLTEHASCLRCHKIRLPTQKCQACKSLTMTQTLTYTSGPRHSEDYCHDCFTIMAEQALRCQACGEIVPSSSADYGNCQLCRIRNATLERSWRCDFCRCIFHSSCREGVIYPLLESSSDGEIVCGLCSVYLNSEQYSYLTEPQLQSLQEQTHFQ